MVLLSFAVSLVIPMAVLACPTGPPCYCGGVGINCASLSLNVIPRFYPSLTGWESLYLYGNNITRIEDYAFANITTGKFLSLVLWHNHINYVSDLAFGGLENTSLKIHLDNNDLTSLPRAMLSLNNVSELTLTGMTNLDVQILKHVAPTLKTLELSMDAQETWPSEIKYLTGLESLKLTRYRIGSENDTFPVNLRHVHMYDINVTVHLDQLCDLESVETIDFTRSFFSHEPIPNCKVPITSAEFLAIDHSFLGTFPRSLITFPNLVTISFSNDGISMVDEAMVPSNNSLQNLHMSKNNLTAIPAAFNKLSQIQFMDLSHNHISSLKDGDFRDLVYLRVLGLAHNPITEISLRTFQNCAKLHSLDLSNTRVVTVPHAIKHLPSLSFGNFRNAPIPCDCQIAWTVNLHAYLGGGCVDSLTTAISYFVRHHARLCGVDPIIG